MSVTTGDAVVGEDAESFSLTCFHCDDGMQYESAAQARRHGWRGIQHDPIGWFWTHIGWCRDCRLEDERPAFALEVEPG